MGRWCRTMQVVKLKAFSKFDNTTEALAAATALVDSKLSKGGFARELDSLVRAGRGGRLKGTVTRVQG